MKLKHYAYIFLGPHLNPDQHHSEIKTDSYQLSVVGIAFDQKEKVIEVSQKLAAQGVQMIELCGGFGAIWIAKIAEALQHKIPVGSVFYGPEARKPILDLLND